MKEKERGMSSAMKMYLQRKREHDMFISKERAEFEVGKQHLAAMMGLDAANLDQEDIDRSIEYLFPSGLAPEARPSMRPPEEVFPRQKDAEFDVEGRPFHPFFYTLKPHFQESVYRMREHLEAVTIFGDRLRRQGKGPDPEQVYIGKVCKCRSLLLISDPQCWQNGWVPMGNSRGDGKSLPRESHRAGAHRLCRPT